MIFKFCLEIAATAAAATVTANDDWELDLDDVVNVIDNQFRIVAMKPKAEKPSD